MLTIRQAETAGDLAEARALFEEYASHLGFDLGFQNFADELAGLPGGYVPPSGCLLLAAEGDAVAGCAAVRQLEERVCELKRMYVRPDFRGRGIGRALALQVIDRAKRAGYHRMRLDTIKAGFEQALALYRSLGFKDIPPYRHNPIEGAVFLELVLTDDLS